MTFAIPEDLAQKLNDIAQRENRLPEDVLRQLLQGYEQRTQENEALRAVRLKTYRKARTYWQQVNDNERLRLTDAELDEQFAFIDPDGIPRLKSDPEVKQAPAPGTLAYLAQAVLEADFHSGLTDQSTRSRDILDSEFTDHIMRRVAGDESNA